MKKNVACKKDKNLAKGKMTSEVAPKYTSLMVKITKLQQKKKKEKRKNIVDSTFS